MHTHMHIHTRVYSLLQSFLLATKLPLPCVTQFLVLCKTKMHFKEQPKLTLSGFDSLDSSGYLPKVLNKKLPLYVSQDLSLLSCSGGITQIGNFVQKILNFERRPLLMTKTSFGWTLKCMFVHNKDCGSSLPALTWGRDPLTAIMDRGNDYRDQQQLSMIINS